jgi:hypothetical protein
VPFGGVFFKGDKLDCDPVFDFYECSIRSTKEFVLTFLDGDKEHRLDLDLLMPNLGKLIDTGFVERFVVRIFSPGSKDPRFDSCTYRSESLGLNDAQPQ